MSNYGVPRDHSDNVLSVGDTIYYLSGPAGKLNTKIVQDKVTSFQHVGQHLMIVKEFNRHRVIHSKVVYKIREEAVAVMNAGLDKEIEDLQAKIKKLEKKKESL